MRVALLLAGAVALAMAARPRRRSSGSRFATLAELRPLRGRAGDPARLPLGTVAVGGWRRLPVALSTPPGDSLLVLGPTGSGKSTSLLVPALLSWEGPVVVASVKDDLLRATRRWRASAGPVEVLAPAGDGTVRYDPVALASSWPAAVRVASGLALASAAGPATGEMAFWSQMAAKLLAGLLLAAHRAGGDVALVATWLEQRAVSEPLGWLDDPADATAQRSLAASLGREERQLGSVLATAETVVDPLLGDAPPTALDPEELLATGGTLYLCAPAHDQRRYAALFAAATDEVLRAAFARAGREGGRLGSPLLVVLDEAAAIAPLAELDVLAATCAGQGITLVTCFQDLAQVRARWGERTGTLVNNHRTRVVLGGMADPSAAELVVGLGGTRREWGAGEGVVEVERPLVAAHELRQLPARSGLVLSGAVPMARIHLRPWWQHRGLASRGSGTSGDRQPGRLGGRVRHGSVAG